MNKHTLLADLLHNGLSYNIALGPEAKFRADEFMRSLSLATPFVADNVARFLYDKGAVDPMRDLPILAPPFEDFWVEYDGFGGDRIGVLFRAQEFDDQQQGMAEAEAIYSAMKGDKYNHTGRIDEPVQWNLFAQMVVKPDGIPGAYGPVFVHFCPITGYGKVAKTSSGDEAHITAFLVDESALFESLSADLLPALATISFLHCKNVVVSDNLPSRQERRLAERKNKPVVTFKTLEIEPMRKVLESEGGLAKNGIKKALHICRGHFAEYTEEKPLFGKYSGRFWIPAHVRGSKDVGEVVKDYRVKAPAMA